MSVARWAAACVRTRAPALPTTTRPFASASPAARLTVPACAPAAVPAAPATRLTEPTAAQLREYADDGFTVVPGVLPADTVAATAAALDECFKGNFDLFGNYPDEWHWREEISKPTATRHGTNFWKASRAVANLVLDPALSRFAAALSGWAAGTRLGNDSVWLKPPSAGGEVAYHRDSWYVPYPMITCWVTLTDVSPANGTLEYVPGSHRWAPAPPIGRDEFHTGAGQYRASAQRLAAAAGVVPTFAQVVAPAGSVAFHHGDLLHGSDVNRSPTAWRKSLGVHLISATSEHGPADGYIYGRYKRVGSRAMSEEAFPITWTPSGYVSPIVPLVLAGKPW